MYNEGIQRRIALINASEVERFHELAHEGSLAALVKLLRRREPCCVEHQGVANPCCPVLGTLMSDVLDRRVELFLTELPWHRAAPFAVFGPPYEFRPGVESKSLPLTSARGSIGVVLRWRRRPEIQFESTLSGAAA
jgi:hypothetical protein